MRMATPHLTVVLAALLLTGCASFSVPSSLVPGVLYRCEQAEGFQVQFGADSAVLTGPRGRQELLRDAGGLTPQQTVYSNADMVAEFGLGSGGQEALLRTLKPASVLRCVRG